MGCVNWLLRLLTPVVVAWIVWTLTWVLSESATVAWTTSICIVIFGLLSTVRTYIMRQRFMRHELIRQYSSPVVASAIVSVIVRMTHF